MARNTLLPLHLHNLKQITWISGLLLVLLNPATISKAQSHQTQADHLIQQGQSYYDQGKYNKALEQWQQAHQLYQDLDHDEGKLGSLINQSLAFKASGNFPRSCETLTQALKIKPQICQTHFNTISTASPNTLFSNLKSQPPQPITITALLNFGNVLRRLGKLEAAATALELSLDQAQKLNLTDHIPYIRLSLANTHQSQYQQAFSQQRLSDDPLDKAVALKTLQAQAQTAFAQYQQLTYSSNPSTRIKGQLNWLQLYLSLDPEVAPELSQLQSQYQTKFSEILNQLLKADFDQLSLTDNISARLKLSEQLLAVHQRQLPITSDHPPLMAALEQAKTALVHANNFRNNRAKSQAYGVLSQIYIQGGQDADAKIVLARASSIAQSIQAWDLAYKWQATLGQLHHRQGERSQALAAYTTSISLLNQVRGNLLATNNDLQFSFYDDVEPIYRQYLHLLLDSPNPNLEQALQVNEQLQQAELENYLRCGKLELVSLSDIQLGPSTALIYILNLGDRYEVILRSPQGSLHHHTPDVGLVSTHLENLLISLQNNRLALTNDQLLLPSTQALYQQLIEPLRPYLPPSGNLHFVLDSTLQNLPMALLHDGDRFLLETYSLSTSLGSELRSPKAIPRNRLNTLIAALSEAGPSFNDPNAPQALAPLPQVDAEVTAISDHTASTRALLNTQFTTQRFQAAVQEFNFPILHISTHGQFSSDPKRTVLLAWNKPINVLELDHLLQSKLHQSDPTLELLVLSACQTAKGDLRSSLGIAGVAAQAGARSTLASLWLVESQSTTLLMEKFYLGLQSGQSKSEALRQAQLSLLQDPQFQHPYFWAPFILVGSWL